MLYYSPSKGPKHRWHKDSCGLEQQKMTKNHFSPRVKRIVESAKRLVNPPSPRRRMPSWKVYPNQNSSWSSWNRLKWRVVFFAFLTVLMCMHYIHVSKKWPMTPEATNPSIRLTGVFFLASQKKWVAAFRLWHLHACSWTPGGLAMCHFFAAGDAGAHSWMTGIQAQVLQRWCKNKKVRCQILLWITNYTYCKSVSYLDRIGFEEIIQVCNESSRCVSSICDIRWWLCCQAL